MSVVHTQTHTATDAQTKNESNQNVNYVRSSGTFGFQFVAWLRTETLTINSFGVSCGRATEHEIERERAREKWLISRTYAQRCAK